MARGNLPGVALARRLLGVGGVEPAAGAAGAAAPVPSQSAGCQAALDRPLLRRAAAWYYAAEYVWRYQRTVAPQRRRGRIVLVDRYVYDLRESPWPGLGGQPGGGGPRAASRHPRAARCARRR